MTPIGAFTFVLHSHLPYVRLAGRWPHGEEWLHEAICETYLPLLTTLYDLREEDVDFKLTIGFTPVLIEQLADPIVLHHLEQYMDTNITAARKDMRFFDGQSIEQDSVFGEVPPVIDHKMRALAERYYREFKTLKTQFLERFKGDILGAYRQLQEDGYIEIMVSAATHAYLPLLQHDSSINAQVSTALNVYEQTFGRKPTSFWLPECAYRPAYMKDDTPRPGLEYFLKTHGLKVFFSETHSITGGAPQGIAEGDAIGPYGEIKRRYIMDESVSTAPRTSTTYEPYFVADTARGETGQVQHSGVTVIARNNETGQQVWSRHTGYPGDFDYREFHRKAPTSGFRYWRVTGDDVTLDKKDTYNPEWAALKVEQHAEHFAHMVSDLLTDYRDKTDSYGLIASVYDTELFGHWWYEGVEWLGKVLRLLAVDPRIELVTAAQFIQQHPPKEVVTIAEGSWGMGGNHFTWHNGETAWMWPLIDEASDQMETLATRFDEPTGDELIVLNQMARELLLLQSSDWPFLITTGQAKEYAIQRFRQHLDRFTRLAESLENNSPDVYAARQFYESDNVFSDMDYRIFRKSPGS